jgi:hypothetical protein
MSKNHTIYVLLTCLVFTVLAMSSFGAITAIAPDQHPNLFFNQQEIDALRQAILVDGSPSYAVSKYNAIRGSGPQSKPHFDGSADWHENYARFLPAQKQNMKACVCYMIEPTSAKANALKSALMSFVTGGGGWEHNVQGGGHCQYGVAWMYDLIYNAGVLSAGEKATIDDFMDRTSRVLAFSPEKWLTSYVTWEAEGSYREGYENFWQLDFNGGYVMAMVSHNQSAVDRINETSVPEDYFLKTLSQFGGDTRDLRNMVNGMVFPSGASFDYYHRGPNQQGEAYHYFNIFSSIFSTEAALHNGAGDAWEYGNRALLRALNFGAPFSDAARRGDINVNWTQIFWGSYRRFPDDPTTSAAVQRSTAMSANGWAFGDILPIWGALGDIQVTPGGPVLNISNGTCTPATVPDSVATEITLLVDADVSEGGSVTQVTADLSALNGPSSQAMTLSSGTTYRTTYQVPAGLQRGTYNIIITATDSENHSRNLTVFVRVTGFFQGWSDNFDDGDANGWSTGGGNWSVVNGQYVNTGTGRSETWAGEPTWDDITYTCDVTPTSNTDVFVIFRVQNANNYYLFTLDGGHGNLYKLVNGNYSLIKAGSGVTFTQDNTYNIRVELSGSSIQVYSGTALVVDATDTQFSSGYVGFGSTGSTGAFDNAEVSAPGGTVITGPFASGSSNDGIRVYPNPFRAGIEISILNHNAEFIYQNVKVQIYDITGKLLTDALCIMPYDLTQKAYWNATSQPAGIYIVKANTGKNVLTKVITLIK